MQHTSQFAAYCLNQDLLVKIVSNFAIGSCLGWQSWKKEVDSDIMLYLQHTAALLQHIRVNAAHCQYWLELHDFFYLCTNLVPKDEQDGIGCKNAHAAAYCCIFAAYWPNCSILPKSAFIGYIFIKLCNWGLFRMAIMKKRGELWYHAVLAYLQQILCKYTLELQFLLIQ